MVRTHRPGRPEEPATAGHGPRRTAQTARLCRGRGDPRRPARPGTGRPAPPGRRALPVVLLAVVAGAALTSPIGAVAASAIPPRTGAALAVRFQPLGEPLLDVLGQREAIDAAVSTGTTEWERILLLKDWVAAQLIWGVPDPYPPWNVLDILDWIRESRTAAFCGQYAQVLLQSLAYIGLQARYIEIGTEDNPTSHYVLEVWSNERRKWIVLDPSYNLHFERDGEPLSALEVHQAVQGGQADQLTVVRGAVTDGLPRPEAWPLRTAEHYAYVRFHLKADHLTIPGNPVDGYGDFDRYEDAVEWVDADGTRPAGSGLTRHTVSRVEPAYPALNGVQVSGAPVTPGLTELRFHHTVVDFAGYEIWIEGVDTAWRPYTEASFLWSLGPGVNRLYVRGRNVRGVSGPVTVVEAGDLEGIGRTSGATPPSRPR